MANENQKNSGNNGADPKSANRAERRRQRGGKRNHERREANAPKATIVSLPVHRVDLPHGKYKFVAWMPGAKASDRPTICFMETTRFTPNRGIITPQGKVTPGSANPGQPEQYQFLSQARKNHQGPYYLLMPTEAQIAKLGPDEWMPWESWVKSRLETLTMTLQHSTSLNRTVPMTHHNGRVVFLEQGSDVVLGQPAVYLLREDGAKVWADFHQAIGASTGGSQLVSRMVEKGEVDISELERIVIQTHAMPNKVNMAIDRVTEPSEERHMQTTSVYANVYALLTDLSNDDKPMVITAASTTSQIKRAAALKIGKVGQDAVNAYHRSQTGHEASFADLYAAKLDQQAILAASMAALTILDLVKSGAVIDELAADHVGSDDLTVVLAEAFSIDAETLAALDSNVQDHMRAKLAHEASRFGAMDFDTFSGLPIGQALPLYAMAKDARLEKLNSRKSRHRRSRKAAATTTAAPVQSTQAAPATSSEAPTGADTTIAASTDANAQTTEQPSA